MPTYAYACTACGHRFEVQQSFSDAALTDCPECAGRLRKLFNSVGIVFKGSGFYRTDSRAGSSSGAESKNGAEDGSPRPRRLAGGEGPPRRRSRLLGGPAVLASAEVLLVVGKSSSSSGTSSSARRRPPPDRHSKAPAA